MRRAVAALLATFCLAQAALAQNFNLSKFTNAQGLPQNYIYSLVQDNSGFVWVGMAEGLSRYDGLHFTNYTTRDSLSDNYISKMIIDTDGYLWCGHGNGTFTYNNGRKFIKVPARDDMTAPIKDMCLDDRGNIWAVEQNMGIVKIDPEHKMTTFFDEDLFGSRVYTSICAVNSMVLLVGTADGLFMVRVDTDGNLSAPEEITDIPATTVTRIAPTRGGADYWVCQDDGSIYRYSPTNGARLLSQCNRVCSGGHVATYDIRAIYEDESGNLYLGTWGDGVKEWEHRPETDDYVEALTLNDENGLGNNYVADIMVDREGIFWFATYGAGVVAWINNYFAQYNMSDIGLVKAKVYSTCLDGERLWLGLNDGIINMDTKCMSNFEFYDKSFGLPEKVDVTSILFHRKSHTQYVGTRGRGIYVRRDGDMRYRPLELSGAQRSQLTINDMVADDTCLYAATAGGLVTYNMASGRFRSYTTADGLPHNNINFVHLDPDGQLWLGPKDSGIAMLYGSNTFDVHRLADVPVDVADMACDDRGRFWLATVNNGILCTSNDSVVSITTADGLEKNYCYGLAKDGNGHIWVCHQPGLSCIDLANGNMRTFGPANGMGYEFTGVEAVEGGDLWFSSTQGVVHYINAYDKRNVVAPIMNLTGVTVSGRKQDIHDDIDLAYPYGGDPDKLEFEFVGICMKDQANVTYEYWMQREGEESTPRWMPLGTQNHKEFDYVPDGDYVLNIRAFNSSGIVSQRPLRISIHVDKPFWKMAWFPIASIAILLLGVRSFAKWRERKLMERQQELEAEVARQTKEINEKKNEIERKNKDITGSITYANRIQTAVLPSRTSLKDLPFADSFLIFRPRDIVSGDFYWFNMYGDHALICCGDCTGHGVPGAFMTLIGTTILNEATREPELRHPAKLLERLDKEVKQTLNKNQAVETRDGMDCSIIDVDMATGVMISAAAKRPIFVVRKGILSTIKGTRRAIGDVWNDNEFVETTTQLQDGDCIYMCSDGYTDQLGLDPAKDAPGGNGQINEEDAIKFSTKRFTALLEEIADEPMEDQMRHLNETYDAWRHNLGAVDDVIVMGLRFRAKAK